MGIRSADVVRSLKHDRQFGRRREWRLLILSFGRREITLIDPYVLSFRKSSFHSCALLASDRGRVPSTLTPTLTLTPTPTPTPAPPGRRRPRVTYTFSRPVHEVDRRGRRALDSSFSTGRRSAAMPLPMHGVPERYRCSKSGSTSSRWEFRQTSISNAVTSQYLAPNRGGVCYS